MASRRSSSSRSTGPPAVGARQHMSRARNAGRKRKPIGVRDDGDRQSKVQDPKSRISIVWYISATFMSVLFLVPLASMLVGSLRRPGLPPPRVIEWLPNPIAWGNYASVFQVADL